MGILMKVTNEQLAQKIDMLATKVDGNSRDIVELYRIINMGSGGLKVIVWLGTILIAVLGWRYMQ